MQGGSTADLMRSCLEIC